MELPTVAPRMGQNHLIGMRPPLAGWMGASVNRRAPVKILPPMLPGSRAKKRVDRNVVVQKEDRDVAEEIVRGPF